MSPRAGFVVAAFALMGPGCDWSPSDVDRFTYRCTTDSDCGEGMRCAETVCTDASRLDGGDRIDAGEDIDAGERTDAGRTDAGGLADAGMPDAGDLADAGEADAGDGADAGTTDAGDAGPGDAGPADGGDDSDGGRADAGEPRWCHQGWCWVEPTPFGADFAQMLSPSLAIVSSGSNLLITDAGDFSYLPDYGAGRCWRGMSGGGQAWLACTEGILRLGGAGAQLLMPPPGDTWSMVVSEDGGVWVFGQSALSRYESPGWVSVAMPTCSNSGSFTALSAREGLFWCTTWETGTAFSDVYSLAAGAAPVFVTRVDGGLDLTARSHDEVYARLWDYGDNKAFRLSLDGGLSEVGTAIRRRLQFASDRQLFQADTSLYRVVGSVWSRTQTFSEEGVIDLWGTTGVQRLGVKLTFFSDAGQVSPQKFSVPDADRRSYEQPLPLARGGAPEFVFRSTVYGFDDAGALTPTLRLPSVPSQSAIEGLADGGLAYTRAPASLVRYVGGVFLTTALPTTFAKTVASTASGAWLVEGNKQVFRVERDGGVAMLDGVDAGGSTVVLRRASENEAVVMVVDHETVIVDLTTLAVRPLVMPPHYPGDFCVMNGQWFAISGAGLLTLDGGAWQLLGGWGNEMECWPARGQVFSAEIGQTYDVDAGAWLQGTSPTRGRAMVQGGRLWVTGVGGAIVVHE